jgi:NAD+ synthase (glutamine-hydrolysing)
MKIALAQINPTVGDFAGNLALAQKACARAMTAGAELVMLPELALCGYPPADLLEKPSFLAACVRSLEELARWTAEPGRPAVLTGAVLPSETAEGKRARNVAVLLRGGRAVALQQKMLLPFYDVFDEQRYFEPALGQELTMLGDQPLAITICEDAWNDKGFWPERNYPVDPVEELMRQWATLPQLGPAGTPKLILNLSASPYWSGKRAVRREMLSAIARRHHAWVAMTNQVGGNDSLIFDGSSLVIAPDGRVVAQAASFAEDLICFDTAISPATLPEFDASGEDETAATWAALVLGIRDYMRKCGFARALIGLSGGIDSALVAALAAEALGVENVMGVGMPSHFSSEGSVDDARQLAANLGIRFETLPIAGVYESLLKTLDPVFAGTPFGLAEENLQARTRGTLLMALSNKTGALVLTTGNKSEMAVGYCTLYGDMVGGLAVIGDVMKLKVYELSRYANREREIIPLNTIEKPPSAELRPGQKDEDSLPPYAVLDPILEAYVERYETAEQIASSQNVDIELVRSVMKLVERSEYKRQQAAPVLKVTKKSFGTGRRFPIAVKY